ncbi:MAG TPA: low-complexity protein [Armatimonadetes bacterium]|nr:low-complexity protein [Armatimonadota bacterium]
MGKSSRDEAHSHVLQLRGANLTAATFIDADLRYADLSGVALCESDLMGAKLQGARLAGADLRGVQLYSAKLDGADFTGAIYGPFGDTVTRFPRSFDPEAHGLVLVRD